MEGICGIISFDGAVSDLDGKIRQMAERLSDGEEVRIRTVKGDYWALTVSGWQEKHWQTIDILYKQGDYALVGVINIYNLSELAEKYRLPEKDLGEILVACYRSGGREWTKQLHGEFSLILVDNQKKMFWAATDRVGIRPLYWYKSGLTYYLGSRISTIRNVCPKLDINQDAVYAFMHHSMIPSPYTIYRGVQKIESGCTVIADANQPQEFRYWDISSTPKIQASEDEIAEQVYRSIEKSIKIMHGDIVSHKHLACFLSGGTDSSSICGLLSRMETDPVTAYSIGFPENGYDEMFYARTAAKAYELAHHEYYVQPDDVLASLPDIVAVYDEPFGNSSVIPTYFCARSAARDGKKYLLAGDGGDEVFAGNERYAMQQVFRNYFNVPKIFRRGLLEPLLIDRLEKMPLQIFKKAGSYIRRAKMPEVQRIHSYRYVSDEEMFTKAFLERCDTPQMASVAENHFQTLTDAEVLDRHLYMDLKMTITDNDLRKVSRMCDLAHVRVRYPLLEEGVIELGFRIPVNLKLKGRFGLRHIFKRAFKDLLPKEILNKEKHGFGLPVSNWLRSETNVKEFAYELLFAPRHLQRGYFPSEFVRRVWDLQLNDNTSYYGTIVWNMIMLEGWHRVHLEGGSLYK